MAIIVESTPALVALIGNPISFLLASDNYLESAGSKASNEITFLDAGTNGDKMTLSWSDKTITIECSNSPDDSGNQVPDKTIIPDLGDWTQALADALQANYLIDQDFVATTNAGVLTLTAREYGAEYRITWVLAWLNPRPTLVVTGGASRTLRPFFKVGLILDILEGATFENIAEDEMPVDAQGQAEFDIHSLFADRIISSFEYPESSATLAILRENHCRAYRIRYFEKYGSVITAKKIITSDTFYGLFGGASFLQQALYNEQGSSYWDKLIYNNYFLTWQPKTKYIDRYQMEKLFFLLQTEISWLSLKARTTYQDGSIITTNIITIADPVQYQVYEFILTLEKLRLAGYDDQSIVKYEVWLQDGSSNILTEIRTFVLDYSSHQTLRYFFFQNSVGGWDTLRITGQQEDGIELSRKEVTKILGADFTGKDHQREYSGVREQKTYKTNTGWKTKEELSWIRDFLLSRKAYQISDRKLIPILLISSKLIQNRDNEDLYSISFEYARAFQNEFYTKQITAPEFNDDYNNDYATE